MVHVHIVPLETWRSLPSQSVPLSKYPSLHTHMKLPMVSVQEALVPQMLGSSEHSSISREIIKEVRGRKGRNKEEVKQDRRRRKRE